MNHMFHFIDDEPEEGMEDEAVEVDGGTTDDTDDEAPSNGDM